MNLELIKLSKERINKANLELAEYLIKESRQSANYMRTWELIDILCSNIASEYTTELYNYIIPARFTLHHQDHGECRMDIHGTYSDGEETVELCFYIAPVKYNLDKVPQIFKDICAKWNKAGEEGNGNYLSHEISNLPSALPDSPSVEFSLTIKAGELINYREYFAALSKALYGRKIYLLPE